MPNPSSEPAFTDASEFAPTDDGAAMAGPRISLTSIITSVVLSLVVLGVVAYFTFEPDSFRQMLNVNPWMLGAAALTVVLRVCFGAWRLHYVAHGGLTWIGALRGQLAWDFFSNVTPSTIGGGPIASAYIAQDQRMPLGEATSIMLFAMLMDQVWFALSIASILGLGFFLEIIPRSFGAVGTWTFTLYFLSFMVWVILFGYATLVRPRLLEKFIGRVFRFRMLARFRERALHEMSQLQHRARILRTQPPWFYVKGFLLTLVVWLNRYLLVLFIIWSVYPSLDKLLVFLRTIAMMLGAVILPTPGGAGGIETFYALMISPLIPDALVAPTLLTWRLMGYYIFIALGAYLTVHQVHKTISRKKNNTDEDAPPNGAPTTATPPESTATKNP